ncbi:MAG: hypothetical protein U0871_25720 [Gemmataceae bacterium]
MLVRPLAVGLMTLTVTGLTAAVSPAGVITSGTGYQVGITTYGNLYDSGIGFRRTDGYDPISPGTPREGYGVRTSTASGYADPQAYGTSLTPGSAVFGSGTASVTTFLGSQLQIDQSFGFVAGNVLKIDVTLTNVSGGTLTGIDFRRAVDFDPSAQFGGGFSETSTANARPAELTGSSYNGFEFPDPTTPFGSPFPAAGGTFGPGDLGGAYDVGVGSLAAGGTYQFSVFYGINDAGQSESALRSQLAGLGATYTISALGTTGGNSAALGFAAAPVPAPAGLLLGLLATPALGLIARRRRLNAAV